MPALFLGHGSPMVTLDDNTYTRAWRLLGESLPRPRAILCVSAHWYLPETLVTGNDRPRTIHDFGGFPKPLFDIQYPAPGDPALALEVAKLLSPTVAALDNEWGLDHGTWTVLRHVYPEADIPVIQLSLNRSQPCLRRVDLYSGVSRCRAFEIVTNWSNLLFCTSLVNPHNAYTCRSCRSPSKLVTFLGTCVACFVTSIRSTGSLKWPRYILSELGQSFLTNRDGMSILHREAVAVRPMSLSEASRPYAAKSQPARASFLFCQRPFGHFS